MLHYPICIFITQRTTFYYYPSRCGFTCLKKPKGNRSKKKVTDFLIESHLFSIRDLTSYFFRFNYLLLKIYFSTLTNCIIIDSIRIDIHFQKLYKYEFKYGTFHTASSIRRGVGSILTECWKYTDGVLEVS